MAKQTINLGTTADDHTGDTLRAGGEKINENFTEIYDAVAAMIPEAAEEPDTNETPFKWFKSEDILLGSGSGTTWTNRGSDPGDAVQPISGRCPTGVQGTDFKYYNFSNVNAMPAAIGWNGITEGWTMFVVARETAGSLDLYRVICQIGLGADTGESGIAYRFGEVYLKQGFTPDYVSTDAPLGDVTKWNVICFCVTDALLKETSINGVYETHDVSDPSTGHTIKDQTTLYIGSDGDAGSNPAVADIGEIIVYDTPLTPERRRSIGLGLTRKFKTAEKPLNVIIGDSIMGAYKNYSYKHPAAVIAAIYGDSKTTRIFEQVGIQASAVRANFLLQIAPYLVPINGVYPRVHMMLGTNDMIGLRNYADILADIQAISDMVRALGCHFTLISQLPLKFGALSYESNRQNLLAAQESAGAGLYDRYIRIGSSPFFGLEATCDHTSIFDNTDKTHPRCPVAMAIGVYEEIATLENRDCREVAVASSATPTINSDVTDFVTITDLATAITSMTTNLTATSPQAGRRLTIMFCDDGTARAITWGAKFESGTGTLPTTTHTFGSPDKGKCLFVKLSWNTLTAKFKCNEVFEQTIGPV